MQTIRFLSFLFLGLSACSLYIEDDSNSDESSHYSGQGSRGSDSSGNPDYEQFCDSEGEDCSLEGCCEGTYCIFELNAYVPSICVAAGETGEYCTENHHCASSLCEDRQCSPCDNSCDQSGSECDYNSCCEGSYCSVELSPYAVPECVAPRELDEYCIDESHCASGLCVAGYCAAP